MTFEELGLSAPLLRAIADAGYTTPTPIQAQAIPHLLMGRDIIGIAQTGTGKTAGFTLPMIEALSTGRARARMPRSLILEPTRELAAQVAENFEVYGKHNKLDMALLNGGVSFSEREDRRLHLSVGHGAVHWPRSGVRASLADPGTDPRARSAGRRELRGVRQASQARHGPADRRRLVQRSGRKARPRCRRPYRNAGTPDRPFRARQGAA